MAEGIAFRETMQGWFALGVTEPREGARTGERAAHALAMHASVAIPDLDRFISKRQEVGQLGGEIEFTPLGRCQATHGLFQLFSPGADQVTRRMVYEMAFVAQGKQYYLAGEKLVHDDPGFDLWSDTTTLYTRLHEGGDKAGPVVGSGILRLGVPQLLAMVGSMEATGEGGIGTVVRFGSFFFGQLWDVYAPHVLGGKDSP